MVSHYPIKSTTFTDKWRHLLGKTVEEVLPCFEEPFASYIFNGEEVYLYDRDTIATIVVKNGIVIRCNDLIETRRSLRVHPSEKIPVILVGEKRTCGYLEDISTAGASLHLTVKSEFSIGSLIEVAFALPIEGKSRYFQILCRVHQNRKLSQGKATIILFDFTDTAWKKRLVSRYVQLSTAQVELGLKDPYQKTFPIPTNLL